MPDPLMTTISATEASALFNASPYCTKWMLYQKFANGMSLETEDNNRMRWGRLLQPLVLAEAARDLRMEVHPNIGDIYHRRGRLGCTRDATIICPDRGPGAIDAKCVFHYRVWMTDWANGAMVPRHIEIQVQQQMLVGDGNPVMPEPYSWGVIAVWCNCEMHYFERTPILKLWGQLETEAEAFFKSVAEKAEPDPFGVPIELPWLTELFPVVAGKVVDLSDNAALTEVAIQYQAAKEQELGSERTAKPLRAKLLGTAGDAEELRLRDGVIVRIKPHGKGKTVKVFVPDGVDEMTVAARSNVPSYAEVLMAG
jgi:hypothetical protein